MEKNARIRISDPQPALKRKCYDWVGVFSDTGIVETFHRPTTAGPVIIGGHLHRVEKRGRDFFHVRYEISPITPVAHRTYFWLDELDATLFDGVL